MQLAPAQHVHTRDQLEQAEPDWCPQHNPCDRGELLVLLRLHLSCVLYAAPGASTVSLCRHCSACWFLPLLM